MATIRLGGVRARVLDLGKGGLYVLPSRQNPYNSLIVRKVLLSVC